MFIAGVSEIVEPPLTDRWTIPGEQRLLSGSQDRDREAFAMQNPIVHYHRLQLIDFLDAIVDNRAPLVRAPTVAVLLNSPKQYIVQAPPAMLDT